ncbi:MAG: hypothetical protein ABW076_16685 [Candidatus Thiodiazotropha sp.]
MRALFITALVLALLPISSFASRQITLPFSEGFDLNNYQDLVWVTNGASHQWLSDGGWQGGGAAKIIPIVTDQGYNGLGQFTGLNTEQLNVRFLIKHGSAWGRRPAQDFTNKVIIFNRPTLRDRPMIISRTYNNETDWVTYGACDNTVCRYEGGDYWPDGSDSYRIGPPPFNRSNEWVSVELEANTRTGLISLYITTQDGVLSGRYVQNSMATPGEVFSYIDVIGGYTNFASIPDPENYFIIDELVIDDSYIGPPAGFIAGNPPSPPTILE